MLEEAMGLAEPEEKNSLYFNPILDSKQEGIWTAEPIDYNNYVRVVRSGQSDKSD